MVEVDVETGHVRIERYLVVEDAGRIINPLIADGQVRGGVAQGIANALYEEIVYAEDGNILTGTLRGSSMTTENFRSRKLTIARPRRATRVSAS